MQFGVKEIREFTRGHSDERIVIIGKRLEECRSKNSKWCDRVAALENQIKNATQWICSDGAPCDGFRFREEMLKLKAMV